MGERNRAAERWPPAGASPRFSTRPRLRNLALQQALAILPTDGTTRAFTAHLEAAHCERMPAISSGASGDRRTAQASPRLLNITLNGSP